MSISFRVPRGSSPHHATSQLPDSCGDHVASRKTRRITDALPGLCPFARAVLIGADTRPKCAVQVRVNEAHSKAECRGQSRTAKTDSAWRLGTAESELSKAGCTTRLLKCRYSRPNNALWLPQLFGTAVSLASPGGPPRNSDPPASLAWFLGKSSCGRSLWSCASQPSVSERLGLSQRTRPLPDQRWSRYNARLANAVGAT